MNAIGKLAATVFFVVGGVIVFAPEQAEQFVKELFEPNNTVNIGAADPVSQNQERPYDAGNTATYDIDGDVLPYAGGGNSGYATYGQQDLDRRVEQNAAHLPPLHDNTSMGANEEEISKISALKQEMDYCYRQYLKAQTQADQKHWWNRYQDAQYELERFRQNIDFRTGRIK